MEDRYIKGTPPMLMLPAKNYVFKDNSKIFEITLPIKGSYHDLDPTFFPEDAGNFNVFDEEAGTIYLPVITKILFAISKYPELEFNQFFIILSLQLKDEEIILKAQVLDMMLAKETEEEV
jgi:hypothetical protein